MSLCSSINDEIALQNVPQQNKKPVPRTGFSPDNFCDTYTAIACLTKPSGIS